MRLVLVLAASLTFAGCSTSPVVYTTKAEQHRLEPLSKRAQVTQWPISVGLYVPPELIARTQVDAYKNPYVSGEIRVPLLEIIPIFRWATEQLFESVRVLEALPATIPQDLAAIVELR